jgi:tRNA(fMet)-specific endonuclease VapC
MKLKLQLRKAARALTNASGNRLLLDTNAIIALQRGDINLKTLLSKTNEVFIPLIAVGELYYGAYKSQQAERNYQSVVAFIADRVVLNPDQNTADIYGQVKSRLQAKGRPIPENDIWIAALALHYDLTLLTQDAHFAEVEGLRSQDWTTFIFPTSEDNDSE